MQPRTVTSSSPITNTHTYVFCNLGAVIHKVSVVIAKLYRVVNGAQVSVILYQHCAPNLSLALSPALMKGCIVNTQNTIHRENHGDRGKKKKQVTHTLDTSTVAASRSA